MADSLFQHTSKALGKVNRRKQEYKNSNNYPNWLDKHGELKELIKEWSRKKESKVILRCFDGEWKFMQKMSQKTVLF